MNLRSCVLLLFHLSLQPQESSSPSCHPFLTYQHTQTHTSPLLRRPYSCRSICSKCSCCSSVWWKALRTRLHSISRFTIGEKGCSRSLGTLVPGFALEEMSLTISSSSSESTADTRAAPSKDNLKGEGEGREEREGKRKGKRKEERRRRGEEGRRKEGGKEEKRRRIIEKRRIEERKENGKAKRRKEGIKFVSQQNHTSAHLLLASFLVAAISPSPFPLLIRKELFLYFDL